MKKPYDIDMAKTNTLIRLNEEKKACTLLPPDYDIVDVANKIGVN